MFWWLRSLPRTPCVSKRVVFYMRFWVPRVLEFSLWSYEGSRGFTCYPPLLPLVVYSIVYSTHTLYRWDRGDSIESNFYLLGGKCNLVFPVLETESGADWKCCVNFVWNYAIAVPWITWWPTLDTSGSWMSGDFSAVSGLFSYHLSDLILSLLWFYYTN